MIYFDFFFCCELLVGSIEMNWTMGINVRLISCLMEVHMQLPLQLFPEQLSCFVLFERNVAFVKRFGII